LKISLPPVIVADANVVLSALIGGRARLVIASPHEPKCIATEAVAHEIARHVPRLAAKRDLDPALLFAALQVMPIEWKPASTYKDQRQEAEKRIADRNPDDWPTVPSRSVSTYRSGLRTKTSTTIAGIEVFTTGELLDALRDAGHSA
jgi:predicted nucleic acid-binding protein